MKVLFDEWILWGFHQIILFTKIHKLTFGVLQGDGLAITLSITVIEYSPAGKVLRYTVIPAKI